MFKLYFRETRPQFLLLTPVCLLVGASLAFWKAGTINVVYLVIVFLGALAAHVAVNVLNDYFDFQSGLDLHTIPTPFSGGSGILPAKQMSPRAPSALELLLWPQQSWWEYIFSLSGAGGFCWWVCPAFCWSVFTPSI
ncbi:MAG: prenyltransferase [Armatimonadetes bacterium]|nr:prenyltransferase [Armatimonadota bacterium]